MQYTQTATDMNFKTSLITIFLALTCTFSYAQRRSSITGKKKYKSSKRGPQRKPVNYINNIKLTGFLGSSKYAGDIEGRFEQIHRSSFSIGGGAQYRWDEHFSFRGDFNLVRIGGDDAYGINFNRNLSFKANIYELNALAVYDLFKFNKMFRRRHILTPYGALGFGVFHFNPKTDLDGTNYSLREYETENVKYSPINYSIQLGGGIRYKFNPQIDFCFEAIYKKTFTDYLDDVSTIYPEDIASWDDATRQNLSLRDGRTPEQAAGTKRGNPDNKDVYLTLGFRIEYTFKVTQQRNNLKGKSSRLRMHKGIRKKR